MSVTLRPMTEAEFAAWREPSVADYAASLAEATGFSPGAARARAEAQFDELLPDGAATSDAWLRVVVAEDSARVGILWVGRHPQRPEVAFVYDIEIEEAARGRGHGRATMLAAEDLVRSEGFREIGLNVFGFNETARSLYDSIGYRVVATQMTKELG